MGEHIVEPSERDTQPCTQPLNDGQDINSEPNGYVWARLYPSIGKLRAYDLTQTEVTVGRSSCCDISISTEELPPNIFKTLSKVHFKISRIPDAPSGGFLENLSLNGTSVNEDPVGSEKFPLRNNDIIAISKPAQTLFYFVENTICEKYPTQLQAKYHVCEILGAGAFGEVTLVFNKETTKGYAMKTCKKAKEIFSESKKLDNEINILKSIQHPNVVQLIDVVECDTEKCLILELMRGGDLNKRINDGKPLAQQLSKLYFYQMACGVDYLHGKGITHRDLKPGNMLLASKDQHTLLKISDFGLSKVMHSDTIMDTFCGTKMFVAPEILISGASEAYTCKVDLWSMGVILYFCLSGEFPFSDEDGMVIDDQIKKGHFEMPQIRWKLISREAKRLVKKMMDVDPDKRFSISMVLADPWLDDPSVKSEVLQLINDWC